MQDARAWKPGSIPVSWGSLGASPPSTTSCPPGHRTLLLRRIRIICYNWVQLGEKIPSDTNAPASLSPDGASSTLVSGVHVVSIAMGAPAATLTEPYGSSGGYR